MAHCVQISLPLSENSPFASSLLFHFSARSDHSPLIARLRFLSNRVRVFARNCAWGSALVLIVPLRAAQAEDKKAPAFEEKPKASVREEEVIVYGKRAPPSRHEQDASIAGSTINRQRLEQPGVSAAEALREAPGMQITQSGGLGSPATARLRGATSAQTPIYFGGVRINDEVGGAADLSTMPAFMIESIRVYRSHAPQSVSQAGVGGALVFVPRKIQKDESRVQGEFGSFGARALRGLSALSQEKRKVMVAVEAQAAENDYTFQNSRGTLFSPNDDEESTLQNADTQSLGIWFSGEERLGKARIGLVMHHAEREQGALKLALVPSENARAEFSRNLLALTSSLPLEEWDGELKLVTSGVSSTTVLDDPQRELGLVAAITRTPGERLEQEITLSHWLTPRLKMRESFVAGVERIRRYERREGTTQLQLAAKRINTRLNLGSEYSLGENTHMDALLSIRCFDTSENDLQLCKQLAPAARAGVRYERNLWEVYLNGGHATRLPTLSELYGAGILVRGNDTLVPERGTTFETGLRAQLNRPGKDALLWLDASAFVRSTDNLLTYVRTAQGYLHPVNRDKARALGGEFVVGARPIAPLLLEANISLIDARDTSPARVTVNDILPYISRATAFLRAQYTWAFDSTWLKESTLGARSYFQSNRYADPAGLAVIPSQFFTDLEIGASSRDELITLRARVSNLFDAARYDVVGFPLPGRSAFLSLETKW